MRIVDTYSFSWTDFLDQWLVELDPAEADQLLAPGNGKWVVFSEPMGVFRLENGAFQSRGKLAEYPASARLLFDVGDGSCLGDGLEEDRVCVWRSPSRERAMIERWGD